MDNPTRLANLCRWYRAARRRSRALEAAYCWHEANYWHELASRHAVRIRKLGGRVPRA